MEFFEVGPVEVWNGKVTLATDGSYSSIAAPATPGTPPAAEWKGIGVQLLKEAATVVIDRGLTAFTAAGASMPSGVWVQKLSIMVDFLKVNTTLAELALALGYLGGAEGVDADGAGLAPVTDGQYSQADAAMAADKTVDQVLALDPNNYLAETAVAAAAGTSQWRALLLRGPSPLYPGKSVELYVPYARNIGAVTYKPGSNEPMPMKFAFQAFDMDGGATMGHLKHGRA